MDDTDLNNPFKNSVHHKRSNSSLIKMIDSLRFLPMELKLFSSITFAVVIFIVVFADSILSNFSLYYQDAGLNDDDHLLQTHQTKGNILQITSIDEDDHRYKAAIPSSNATKIIHPEYYSALFETTPQSSTTFDARIARFLGSKSCKIQIFMTWISPADSFGKREFLGLESLFHTNPKSCLVILSTTMDSTKGRKILNPLTNLGYRIRAMNPHMDSLLKNTPAQAWFEGIRNGRTNAGEISLAQNLSNLIRLAALYKYGGVYLDVDFVILKDISPLRNSIGAQSVDGSGNWTRLNNAFLVFEKKHLLVYKFMEEFASTFDGNKWGHNGPYLVSRVVNRLLADGGNNGGLNFTILPRTAFYPVDWTRVAGFFHRPKDRAGEKWVEAKIKQLKLSSYGVHLWNRQSSNFKIEEGSVVHGLLARHCVICDI